MLIAFGLAPARGQDPIVFGVIVPLSPPGETALGQLAKRGAEIGAEYINEKGGVLGRKVELSIHDSAGKNEQGVAAYRRLVSSEKVAVFGFIHSGVNIAVNEVAKEMGVPTMRLRTAQVADFVGQRIIHILVELAFALEHHERSCCGRNGKALEPLVALRVRANQPVNRHGMEQQHPVQSGGDDRPPGAHQAALELFPREVVLGHVRPSSVRAP